MIARRTALTIAAIVVGATAAAIVTGQVLARAPARTPPPPLPPSPILAGAPQVRWVVDVAGRAPVPDRIVHAPVVIGDRVLIAAARVGYVGLDLATGAIAWRRPAGPELAAPLVLAPRDVVLVHACDVPVGTAAGRSLVACYERIDPLAIAARAAGGIDAADDDAAPCLASMAPWRVTGTSAGLVIARDGCALAVPLPAGAATATTAPPAPPPLDELGADCGVTADGTPWCQRVAGGASTVEVAGVRVPGLAVLAAATAGERAAVVVRRDATLRDDVLVAVVGGAVAWTWPLPPPAEARATPVAVALDATGVYVVFDSSRVAALAPPGA
ncbi:MAG: hypothetical protein IPL61_23980 [Myxococcales bacterium]|nr:hypothetical protein [Myxococcales bacterium]